MDNVHLKATYIISKEITERLALALYFLLHLNQNTSPYTNVGKYSEWIQSGTLRVFLSTNKLFKAKVLNRLMRKLASVKLLPRLSSCGNISRLV